MVAIVKNNKRYVTYFESGVKFDPNKIHTNLDSSFNNKPKTAWWGSPEDCLYGWKDWTEDEEFGDYDFENPIKWHLEEGSKLFQIDWEDMIIDIENNEFIKYLYKIDEIGTEIGPEDLREFHTRIKINFKKMKEDGIDAVELMDARIGHMFHNNLENMFNSWDCESICVLDPSKIIFEKE